jgi:hypothetical protein
MINLVESNFHTPVNYDGCDMKRIWGRGKSNLRLMRREIGRGVIFYNTVKNPVWGNRLILKREILIRSFSYEIIHDDKKFGWELATKDFYHRFHKLFKCGYLGFSYDPTSYVIPSILWNN